MIWADVYQILQVSLHRRESRTRTSTVFYVIFSGCGKGGLDISNIHRGPQLPATWMGSGRSRSLCGLRRTSEVAQALSPPGPSGLSPLVPDEIHSGSLRQAVWWQPSNWQAGTSGARWDGGWEAMCGVRSGRYAFPEVLGPAQILKCACYLLLLTFAFPLLLFILCVLV
jgi:hypothetical protein